MDILYDLFPCCTKRNQSVKKSKITRNKSFMVMGNVETEEEIDLSTLSVISGNPKFKRKSLILEPHGTYLCKCNCNENKFFWKVGDNIKFNNICVFNTYKNSERLRLFTNLEDHYINITICKM